MTNSRYGRHFLAAFMVILWVVAVGSAADVRSAASPEWDSIVKRAEEEGQVTVYATDSIGNAQMIWAAFQKRYPKIKLVGTTLGRGSDLFPKLYGERRAGKFLADVFLGAPSAIYLNLYRAKIIEPIPPMLVHPERDRRVKMVDGKASLYRCRGSVHFHVRERSLRPAALLQYQPRQ